MIAVPSHHVSHMLCWFRREWTQSLFARELRLGTHTWHSFSFYAGLHHRVDDYPQYSDKIALVKMDTAPSWLLLDWALEQAYRWMSTTYNTSSKLNRVVTYLEQTLQAQS